MEKIQEWIKENIFNLNIDISGKDYLKIFFDYPIEEYLKENKRYLIPNIYNKNDFNINVGDKIYGLPNDNMGLNAKKPYLENKTRKSTVSYLIDNREVLIQRKFFEYLMNMASVGKVNIYIDDKITALPNGESIDRDFQGVFIRLQKGKEVEIHDYDVITKYRYTLRKPFKYKNILLSFAFVYNFGHVFRIAYPTMNPLEGDADLSAFVAKRWQKPGDENETDIPATLTWESYDGVRQHLASYSSNSVRKGDFIRLREITLNYELPSQLIKKTPFSRVSLTAQANTVWMWTKNKEGFDPEAVDPIHGTLGLSEAPSFTFGLRVEF